MESVFHSESLSWPDFVGNKTRSMRMVYVQWKPLTAMPGSKRFLRIRVARIRFIGLSILFSSFIEVFAEHYKTVGGIVIVFRLRDPRLHRASYMVVSAAKFVCRSSAVVCEFVSYRKLTNCCK